MPTTGGKELALGRIYSDSMLALAEAQGQADALLEELLDLAAYITQNADFAEFLSSPMIDSAARERFIEKMLRGKASDLLVDSLQVLNRKDRVELLPAIIEAYRLQLEELRGVVDVHVVTAVPLTDELRETVKNVAGKYAGKTAQLIESVDESIIGGMIVKIGDRKIDASVASRLGKLERVLSQRASQELHGKADYVVGTAA